VAFTAGSQVGPLLISSARPGSDDEWCVAARSNSAGIAVATMLADVIAQLEVPWRLELTGIRNGDVALEVLARRLPNAQRILGSPVPHITFEAGDESAALLRPSVRDGVRRSAGRVAKDGLREEVWFESDPRRLWALQDEIEAAHRARDHDAGRVSDIDDDVALHFWRSAYVRHARAGALELATLRFDGRLAAYVVAFVDPPAYRVFDGRFVPAWRRYSPGRRLEVAVLERVMEDERLAQLDWMSSVAPEALIGATGTRQTWTLVAGSPVQHLSELVAVS
jgi:hypothetical protein